MQKVALVLVLNEYVHNRLQQVLLDQVHHECLVLGTDHSLVEFDDPQVEQLRVEPLQPRDLLDDLLLDSENPEPESMLLRALGDQLDDQGSRVFQGPIVLLVISEVVSCANVCHGLLTLFGILNSCCILNVGQEGKEDGENLLVKEIIKLNLLFCLLIIQENLKELKDLNLNTLLIRVEQM